MYGKYYITKIRAELGEMGNLYMVGFASHLQQKIFSPLAL